MISGEVRKRGEVEGWSGVVKARVGLETELGLGDTAETIDFLYIPQRISNTKEGIVTNIIGIKNRKGKRRRGNAVNA